MSDALPPPDPPTPEEKRFLEFLAAVVNVFRGRNKPAPEPVKPGWQRFLESTGGAALITVVIGGIAGGIITDKIQTGNKNRELALADYKEHLKQEQEIVSQAYILVGNSISSADDLIDITDPQFDPNNPIYERDKQAQENLRSQRKAVRDSYHAAEHEWNRGQEKMGLLMGYYHPGHPEIVTTWRAVNEAVTNYSYCANQLYRLSLTEFDPDNTCASACVVKKRALRGWLDQLTIELATARQTP